MRNLPDFFKDKKTIIGLIILGLILLSLPATIKLAQERQIIKSRASEGNSCLDQAGGYHESGTTWWGDCENDVQVEYICQNGATTTTKRGRECTSTSSTCDGRLEGETWPSIGCTSGRQYVYRCFGGKKIVQEDAPCAVRTCQKDSDCSGGTDCQIPACDPNYKGEGCGFFNIPKGNSCGSGKECDGNGKCVEPASGGGGNPSGGGTPAESSGAGTAQLCNANLEINGSNTVECLDERACKGKRYTNYLRTDPDGKIWCNYSTQCVEVVCPATAPTAAPTPTVPQTGTTGKSSAAGANACQDDPPGTSVSYPGMSWKADCSRSCNSNAGCQQSGDAYVLTKHSADSTNWCFGNFDGGAKCLQMAVKNPPGGAINCEGNSNCAYSGANPQVALNVSWQGLKECFDSGVVASGQSGCNYVGAELCVRDVGSPTWQLVAAGGSDPKGKTLFPDGLLPRVPPSGGLPWMASPGVTKEFGLFETAYTCPDQACLSEQYKVRACKGKLITQRTVTTTGSGTSTAAPTTVPTQSPVSATTNKFRIAENPADLDAAAWQDYTSAPVTLNFEFKDKTPGQKFIWVEFLDSNGKKERHNVQIKLLGADPKITSCFLKFEGSNTVVNLTGQNFGATKGLIKSGESDLQIKSWNNDAVQALWPSNTPEGESLPVVLKNTDGQASNEGRCSAVSQLSLGAKVFCRAPSSHDTENVDLVIAGSFAGGTKAKEKVKISRDGIIQGLTQKLEAGKNYILSLKAPKSLRKTVPFTAQSGSTNIPNFVLPIGDIFPADGGDGVINALDKSELNRQWIIAQDAGNRSGDFNKDGRVNSIDWACMRYDFGQSDNPEPVPGAPVVPFCGGIAGVKCPEAYVCILESSRPDAGGKCIVPSTPSPSPSSSPKASPSPSASPAS